MREAKLSRLGSCLLDSDPRSLSQSRRSRIFSLLTSLLFQSVLLTAAIVLPMFATGKLERHVTLIPPGPPYPGRANRTVAKQPPSGQRNNFTRPRRPLDSLIAPPHIPPRTSVVNDINERNATEPVDDIPLGDPNGVMRPPVGLDIGPWRNPHVPEQPKPPRVQIIRRGGDVQAARLIHRVDPKYPILPLQARMEGTVVLRAIIARDGTVRELEVVSGHELFRKAALEAVTQWRYQPTLLNGEPVEVETVITVVFTLHR